MMKLRALVGVLAAATLAACGGSDTPTTGSVSKDCTPKYETKTLTDGVLKVGVINYPPYSTFADKRLGGIDGAIVSGFARAACLKVEAQETTFAAAVSSVQTRRVDVAFGDLYRTKDRAKAVALSDPVYLDQLGIVSKTGLDSVAALEGKTIATVQGYFFVDAIKQTFGKNVHLFPDSPKMYQDLFAGRSQALLDSYPAAVQYLKETGKKDFQVKVAPADPRIPATGSDAAQNAYAYNRDATELGKAINAYLADIRSNGELAKILVANGLKASAAKVGAPRLS